MKTLATILILLFGSLYQLTAQCSAGDFKALKDLYDNTNGTSWTNNTGWDIVANNSTPPTGCNLSLLHGITINSNGRVEGINLANNNLVGPFGSFIELLAELKALNLSKNKMSGIIPSSLGDIPTLEVLQLQENNLGGTTGFTGSIPITGSNFPALRILRLNKNSLSGGIPEGIGTTVNLEEIGIHNNNLGGTLPPSIGYLPNLTNLKLFNNSLTGCFPPSYFSLCPQLTNANIDNGNFLNATWASFCQQGTGACDEPFISTWKTDNLGVQGSCSSCIIIPTDGGSIYKYDIDWENDGTYDEFNVTGDMLHDYGTSGTYQVAIKGDFPRILFSGTGENEKILSVDQWGDNRWFSMAGAFHTCSNLNILATDSPTLTNVTDMSGMFSTASSMNEDISHWNVSKVTNMSAMFFNATSFNQDLSSWNISGVSDMISMLNLCDMSENNYDQTIIGWSEQNVQSNVTLGAEDLTYCNSYIARQILINKGWVFVEDINSCPQPLSFITTWKTDNDGTSCTSCITIPTTGSGYNYDVDWENDGIFDEFGLTGNATKTFASPGTKTIAIRGDFPRIYFNNTGDKEKLLSVDQWGDINWSSMFRSFSGCSNLTLSAIDQPDLSGVTILASMFTDCSSLNSDLSSWDVSTITSMNSMFSGAEVFNSPLNWGIKTANVTDMSSMFSRAQAFNQNISAWDVSTVTNMGSMFFSAAAFNNPLNWGNNTANVTNMFGMFQSATAFNQDISGWDVFSVTNMAQMFLSASAFNQDLSIWSVSSVTNMFAMFHSASAFNQDLSIWNVSSVTIMASMFNGASAFNSPLDWSDKTANVTSMQAIFDGASAFNQDISSWDVSSVTNMSHMFSGASAFNQDISSWVVSSVTNMSQMFKDAHAFNSPLNWGNNTSNVTSMNSMFAGAFTFDQDLSALDVSSVTLMSFMFKDAVSFNSSVEWGSKTSQVINMDEMFKGASSFNRDIANWNISSVLNMTRMLSSSGMSVMNYDKALISWAAQTPPLNIFFESENLYYCKSSQARQTLIDAFNWTIDKDEQDTGTNSYTDSSGGDWHNPSLWSLLRIPSTCNEVVLDQGGTIDLKPGEEGYGATLDIMIGTSYEVEVGATLEIKQTSQ